MAARPLILKSNVRRKVWAYKMLPRSSNSGIGRHGPLGSFSSEGHQNHTNRDMILLTLFNTNLPFLLHTHLFLYKRPMHWNHRVLLLISRMCRSQMQPHAFFCFWVTYASWTLFYLEYISLSSSYMGKLLLWNIWCSVDYTENGRLGSPIPLWTPLNSVMYWISEHYNTLQEISLI